MEAFSLYSSAIADFLGKKLRGEDLAVFGVSSLDAIKANTLTFMNHFTEDNKRKLDGSSNFLLLCREDLLGKFKGSYIVVENPRLDFAKIINNFFSRKKPPEIHKTAIIETKKIGKNVSIGAYSIIGENVEIGDNTYIGNNVTIQGNTSLGKNCKIKSGAVIGEDGFGFERDENGLPVQFNSMGYIQIGNDVFLGSNSSIELGSIDGTVISDNVKIDDLVQIGHNCAIGDSTLVMAGVVLCGGVRIGSHCWIAPGTYVRQKVKIGNNSMTGLGSIVVKDVVDNSLVFGNPAKARSSR